jgi:putative transposase
MLQRCTHAGRPFGGEAFVNRLEPHFQRSRQRWGFEKLVASA